MNTHLLIAVVVWLALITLTVAWMVLNSARKRAIDELAKEVAARPFADTAAPAPVKIEMVVGDITTEKADAIVNAAKPTLLGGGGVDGAIHKAGGPAILDECKMLRAHQLKNGLPTGLAVATTAGDLNASIVIHTVGPVWRGVQFPRADQLRSCYLESLKVAEQYGARVVAFPLISSGVYGWPTKDAIRQALIALRSAETSVKVARLVFFDHGTYDLARSVEREMI